MNKGPKILFYDIETSDLAGNRGTLLCIGYKWAHEKKAKMLTLRSNLKQYQKTPWNDKELLESFRPVLEKADLVVYQFGDYFDSIFLNTRIIEHSLKPLPDITSVDTCKISWKHLRMSRNSLQQLGDLVQRRDKEADRIRKTPLELTTWLWAGRGVVKDLKQVEEHCYQDIYLLEKIYNVLAPFMRNHPNLARIYDGRACPVCRSKTITKNGYRFNARSMNQRWACRECGHYYCTPLARKGVKG